ISAFCPTCREVPEALKEVLSDEPDVNVVLICIGKPEDCKFVSERLRSRATVLCDDGTELVHTFRITTFPTTILADGSGTVRTVAHPVSAQQCRALLMPDINRISIVSA